MGLQPAQPGAGLAEPDRLPKGVRRIAARVHASSVVVLPVHVEGRVRGSLELMRAGVAFDDGERRLARVAAAQVALAIRAFGRDGAVGDGPNPAAVLSLAGDALAAGADG